ncbi:MAG: hypothetical protein ACOCYT_03275 [Chloroflexota bacterium]
MSNDPNRIVQQQRHVQENRGHSTLETVKIEKGMAQLPMWQQRIIYVLAFIGVIALIVVALAVLGVF